MDQETNYAQKSMALPEKFTENWFSSDQAFNRLYPLAIQKLAVRHWTPLYVARKVVDFLAAEAGVRILDVGSGVGKFCLSAAHYKPNAYFYGVEQRKMLIHYAEEARKKLVLENASFIQGNFTQLDFTKFDHFYYYNAFYENLADTDRIDESIDYSCELYNYYNRYFYKQLEQKPAGTRLATFHSLEYEVPTNYHIVGTECDNLLKFWIKV
jgi:SAM-dependent methyltransferase